MQHDVTFENGTGRIFIDAVATAVKYAGDGPLRQVLVEFRPGRVHLHATNGKSIVEFAIPANVVARLVGTHALIGGRLAPVTGDENVDIATPAHMLKLKLRKHVTEARATFLDVKSTATAVQLDLTVYGKTTRLGTGKPSNHPLSRPGAVDKVWAPVADTTDRASAPQDIERIQTAVDLLAQFKHIAPAHLHMNGTRLVGTVGNLARVCIDVHTEPSGAVPLNEWGGGGLRAAA